MKKLALVASLAVVGLTVVWQKRKAHRVDHALWADATDTVE
ncbi:DLW-39 family protein [Saxibacter everestensis]|uniref:DLW-39 family protein n=1 Tax=Saxibacter everestensis TaxID=2909229 RepID=A0ABY8QTM4_9MICO|nr:DLW-39 family protein [Brevibacteriaceae bacterium ZFBP1038]